MMQELFAIVKLVFVAILLSAALVPFVEQLVNMSRQAEEREWKAETDDLLRTVDASR